MTTRDDIRASLGVAANISLDDFRRLDPDDAFGLNVWLTKLAALVELVEVMKACSLAALSERASSELNSAASELGRAIGHVLEFNAQAVPPRQRDQGKRDLHKRLQALDTAHQNHLATVAGPLALASVVDAGIARSRAELESELRRQSLTINAELDSIRHEINKTAQDAETSRHELEVIVESARNAAKQFGVTQHATVFASQATRHRQWGHSWLCVTALSAFVLAIIAIADLRHIESDGTATGWVAYLFPTGPSSSAVSTPTIIRSVTLRLIIYGLLSFWVGWSARNYSAQRHNEVVNQHRANALSTFQVFSNASADDLELRRAVLLRATETIFTPATTGYTGGEQLAPVSPSLVQVMERASRDVVQSTK